MDKIEIRTFGADDWPAVRRIWAEGLETGHAAYIQEPPTWEFFDAHKDPEHRWLAVDEDGTPLGWTCIAVRSDHELLAGMSELSLYVSAAARGNGIGTALLERLIASTEAAGIWRLTSLVFPENTASIALHHKLGFRTVGIMERYAFMGYGPLAGQWRDNTLLERRSVRTGI